MTRPARAVGATLSACGVILAALALLGAPPLRAQAAADIWTRPQAEVKAELGIDSLDRRFYRPVFSLAFPVAGAGGSRLKLEVDFLQRMNGALQGTSDYWVRVGAEQRISDEIAVEAALNHFCRHLSSIANPYVLNLNELLGRVVVRSGGLMLGVGFGPFIGGSRGYDKLAAFSLDAASFLLPEMSFAGELKWVDFERFYYEATMSVGLGGGIEIFLRAARHYNYPAAAYLGLRLRTDGPLRQNVGDFAITAGIYPYYDVNKLLVVGSYRLQLMQREDRRFLASIDFQTPLLSGSSFFAQFWPDRMLHAASAEYERTLPGGMRAAWYARYVIDMPVDKAVRFRSHLATGLLVRNQPEFERLDKPIRFEIAIGYDFAFAYDARLKLGVNFSLGSGLAKAGAEFLLEANDEQQSAHGKAFIAFGREIEVRPFIGIRKITYLAGGPPPPDPFRSRLTFGVTFLKWL
ncbi:MAG: hypothetical protein NTZ26_04680 [Candidatus Aminicenantes bacterium]|nr:hypothetical protein [Candidatus Aminicenantes bacterium]